MEKIYVSSDKAAEKQLPAENFIVCAVVLFGFMALFGPFQANAGRTFISMAAGFSALGLANVFSGLKRAAPFTAAITAAVAAVFFNRFSAGALMFANDIVSALNLRFSAQLVSFAAEGSAFDKTFFFAILFATAGIWVNSLSSGRKLYAFGAAEFLIFELFAVLQLRQSAAVFAAAMVSMIVCWVKSCAFSGSHWGNLVAVGAITALLCLGFGLLLGGYGGSAAVYRLRRGIVQQTAAARYGESTLPDGDMSRAALMAKGDETVLKVTVSRPQDEYLGGFVGADYSPDGVWSVHGSEIFQGEWNGIFRWLSGSGFYPRFQFSKYAEAAEDELEEVSVTVENVGGNRKYLYLPHTLKSIDRGGYKLKNDLGVAAKGLFGAKSYSFTQYYYGSAADEFMYAPVSDSRLDNETREYMRTQSVYAGFAEAAYTKIDDETKEIIDKTFFDTEYLNEESGIYSVVSRIRAVLALRADYSSAPKKYSQGGNFAKWFLEEAGTGNSAYFATVGTLALRAAGFPARYAEGYYIPAESGKHVSVTPKNSHAWSEVYINQAGWVPVEFTPGYYADTIYNEKIVEISKDVAGGGAKEESPYSMTEQYKDETRTDQTEIFGWHGFSPIEAVWIFGALFAAFALFAAVRWAVITLLRRKKFKAAGAERYIYGYIFKMLSLGGVDCDSARPTLCAAEVAEKFEGVRVQEYLRMVSLMQKTVFGEKRLTSAEGRSIRLFCKKTRRLLYGKSGRLRRVVLALVYVV